jgi:hypothetical protein
MILLILNVMVRYLWRGPRQQTEKSKPFLSLHFDQIQSNCKGKGIVNRLNANLYSSLDRNFQTYIDINPNFAFARFSNCDVANVLVKLRLC